MFENCNLSGLDVSKKKKRKEKPRKTSNKKFQSCISAAKIKMNLSQIVLLYKFVLKNPGPMFIHNVPISEISQISRPVLR
jgi:hypothetical protein